MTLYASAVGEGYPTIGERSSRNGGILVAESTPDATGYRPLEADMRRAGWIAAAAAAALTMAGCGAGDDEATATTSTEEATATTDRRASPPTTTTPALQQATIEQQVWNDELAKYDGIDRLAAQEFAWRVCIKLSDGTAATFVIASVEALTEVDNATIEALSAEQQVSLLATGVVAFCPGNSVALQ